MNACPDSPPVPEPVRKPRARPPRWVIVVVGAITLLICAGWWSQRPLARIPLPGGGALRLVMAHYAPTYHDVRPIGLMEHLKRWLPKQRNNPPSPVGSRDYGKAGDSPRLWLVFEADGVK